jgi:hypothetical protein
LYATIVVFRTTADTAFQSVIIQDCKDRLSGWLSAAELFTTIHVYHKDCA